jgi:glutaredoxin
VPSKIDIEEIAKKNPSVDLEALEEGRKLRENLRQIGGVRERPTIVATGRKRVRIDDSITSDPRVVRLQRPSN